MPCTTPTARLQRAKPLSHRTSTDSPTAASDDRGVVVRVVARGGRLFSMAEPRRRARAGADWLHVDIFDGSKASNGALSSMGPQTVKALRKRTPGRLLAPCTWGGPSGKLSRRPARGLAVQRVDLPVRVLQRAIWMRPRSCWSSLEAPR